MYTLQSDLTQVPNYSGGEYNRFLAGSALSGWGDAFASIGARHGVNPIYLMALTIFESGWGTSNFAKTRNNYWGYAAFDTNTSAAAYFTTPHQGLEFIAHWLKNTYLRAPQVVGGKRMVYQMLPYQVGKPVLYSYVGGWYGGEPTLEGVYKVGKFEGKPGKYATAPHAATSMLALMNKIVTFLGSPIGAIVVTNAPAPQENTSLEEYVVKAGDSLWKIAAAIYGDGNKWLDLATANGIAAPRYIIHPGQRLRLPGRSSGGGGGNTSGVPHSAARTYTVASGDSLWKIAIKFYGNGNRYNEIFAANRDKLSNPSLIKVGQILRIP